MTLLEKLASDPTFLHLLAEGTGLFLQEEDMAVLEEAQKAGIISDKARKVVDRLLDKFLNDPEAQEFVLEAYRVRGAGGERLQ